MTGLNGINLEHASGYSASDSVIAHPLWLNSAHISPTSFPKSLNLNINSSADGSDQMKQLGQQLHEQDCSSTQSTGQSHQGIIMRAGNVHLQFLSAKSGSDDVDAMKDTGVNIKSVLSLGASETAYSAPKVDFSESDAGISYTCIDPCFGGFLAAYGSHGIFMASLASFNSEAGRTTDMPLQINTQLVNNAPPGRIPLPIQLTDDGPIYVNAKQYHGILRRRQQRAKLAALNKLVSVRKPYLHESRHRHAMRRIRGPGGRFLNTKQLKQQKEQLDWQCQQSRPYVSATDGKASSAPSLVADGGGRLWGYNLQLMNGNGTASGDSSASDITNASNPSDAFELVDHIGFTEFLGGTSSGVGMLYNRSQPRVPVIR